MAVREVRTEEKEKELVVEKSSLEQFKKGKGVQLRFTVRGAQERGRAQGGTETGVVV